LGHKLAINGHTRSLINEAAFESPKQPIINMAQGFFGYNPPPFIINAAKQVLDRVECNQYSPPKGRMRLKKAIANAYSAHWGRTLNPETEVVITTGANEGACHVLLVHQTPG
jgi:kynurenine aminotransferase